LQVAVDGTTKQGVIEHEAQTASATESLNPTLDGSEGVKQFACTLRGRRAKDSGGLGRRLETYRRDFPVEDASNALCSRFYFGRVWNRLTRGQASANLSVGAYYPVDGLFVRGLTDEGKRCAPGIEILGDPLKLRVAASDFIRERTNERGEVLYDCREVLKPYLSTDREGNGVVCHGDLRS